MNAKLFSLYYHSHSISKGQKATVQAAADAAGESINQYTNKAILARMGRTEWPEGAEE